MSVRLKAFQYRPRGPNGWSSPLLNFGEMFTAVQGDNGAGKTPIMKGVMQGLGHEVELPPEIVARCESAEITLSVDGRDVVLERLLGPEFELRVKDGEERTPFTNQAEYAQWFTRLFHAEPPELTTKQSQSSPLYANVLLPAIWVDQDHGWTTDYWTPPNRNFIQDQRQEVIRFLLGMPPRHPFRGRAAFDIAKDTLERTEKALDLQRFVVERLRTNEGLRDNEEPELLERRAGLREQLDANRSALEAIRSTTAFFDNQIADLEDQRARLLRRQNAVSERKGQLNLVLSELDGEEEVLTANVQATDLLRIFCAREGCQMFSTSERSFGRSLLYLKDQIKDIKMSDRSLSRDMTAIADQLGTLDAALATKRAERYAAVDDSPQRSMSVKLTSLTKQLVDVELRLAKSQQYSAEQKKFERLLDQREQASTAVDELRPKRGKAVALVDDVRQMLSDSIQTWLVTLGTQNTKSASFDSDFVLYVDGQKFSITTHQSGSTRTRIVLAFHAALLDVALKRGGNHPGWLVFDAPKQHELSQKDFDAYTDRLVRLAAAYPGRVQVVFSVADLKTQFEVGDEVWAPWFTVNGEARFLGSVDELVT